MCTHERVEILAFVSPAARQFPCREKPEPSLEYVLRDKPLPRCASVKTLHFFPISTDLLTESEEPKMAVSITDMWLTEPTFAMHRMEQLDPKRAKFLKLIEDPMWENPRTLIADPSLVNDRMLQELPIEMKSNSDKALEHRDTERRLIDDPKCMKFNADKLLPRRLKSRRESVLPMPQNVQSETFGCLPTHLEYDLIESVLPSWTKFIMDNSAPSLIFERTDVDDPILTKLRMDNALPIIACVRREVPYWAELSLFLPHLMKCLTDTLEASLKLPCTENIRFSANSPSEWNARPTSDKADPILAKALKEIALPNWMKPNTEQALPDLKTLRKLKALPSCR
jgi:hypothetical protein